MTDLNAKLAIPVSTIETIPGRQVAEYKGAAFGVIVQSAGAARGFTGYFKSIKKGEVSEYTSTISEARRIAVDRLIEHAQAMGADAVVGLRFDSSDVGGNGLGEMVAYGTAVKLA
jgi:uncharacterized protein YbjQ (UPF0145 family)